MPIKNARYRRKGKMRLAFRDGEVVEAKNMETGEMHTESEMKHDEEMQKKRRRMMKMKKKRM